MRLSCQRGFMGLRRSGFVQDLTNRTITAQALDVVARLDALPAIELHEIHQVIDHVIDRVVKSLMPAF